MSGGSFTALESTFALVLLVLFILGRRAYAMVRGAVYSPGRIVGFVGFAAAVYVLFGASTLYDAVSTWGVLALSLVAAYPLVVAGAAIVTAPHVRKVVRFERRPDGLTYYRIPWLIPVLYLVLFAARFGLEVFFVGTAGFFAPGPATSLAPGAIEALLVFDLLYGASLGLLIGRSVGIVRAHRALPPPAATEAPLPSPGGPPR